MFFKGATLPLNWHSLISLPIFYFISIFTTFRSNDIISLLTQVMVNTGSDSLLLSIFTDHNSYTFSENSCVCGGDGCKRTDLADQLWAWNTRQLSHVLANTKSSVRHAINS